MRTLFLGTKGDDVKSWQNFLIGINPMSNVIVDGDFGPITHAETKKFQSDVSLTSDGIVGPATLGRAMQIGLDPLQDDSQDEFGPNWPPRSAEGPLTGADRGKLFGNFAYKSATSSSNPEAIIITDGWATNNIVTSNVPQLKNISGSSGKVTIHKLVAPQLLRTFNAWEQAGLLDRILTWGGSWVPRYIRGSRTYLSNHAWGTAFDINVQWNMLGTRPTLKGQKGCVRELVKIAYDNGWYWGGWFKGRPDGMHFEAYKVIP